MAATSILIAAFSFGGAALAGSVMARRLCAGCRPFADGPSPGKPIVPVFVAGSALVGAGVAAHGVPPLHLISLAALSLALVGACSADILAGVIPDVFTLVPLGALIVTAFASSDFLLPISAAGVAVPFAAVAISSRGLGMGWGDVKLAALGGAMLGLQSAALAFSAACLVVGLRYAVARSRSSAPVAFAPYLVGAIAASIAIRVF